MQSLQNPLLRPLGRGAVPAPQPVTVSEARSGEQESHLVRVEARLLHSQWAAGQYSLLLDAAGTIFSAMLPAANAMRGDREVFLEAGMNDYVVKPFELAEINRALSTVMAPAVL